MNHVIKLFAALLLAPLATLQSPGAPNPQHRPGLLYERFGNTDLTRSFGTRYAPNLDAMDNENNDYGLRFTGFLAAPIAGEYFFRVEADTGARLILGSKTVIDGWAPTGARAGKAALTNRLTLFTVEYFFDNRSGGKKAALRLFWTPPGGSERPVPASAYSHTPPPPPPPPAPEAMAAALIKIQGDDQGRLDLKLPDGGLKPAVGTHNVQIFRSTRSRPDLADGEGWTFAHHQDLACWKGRLYVAWGRAPVGSDGSLAGLRREERGARWFGRPVGDAGRVPRGRTGHPPRAAHQDALT
jgi:hypothetical protein